MIRSRPLLAGAAAKRRVAGVALLLAILVPFAALNRDGWLDIFVISYGTVDQRFTMPGNHRLYRNNGDGTFTDIAARVGVATTSLKQPTGTGASFGDYDLDGDLDLAVDTAARADLAPDGFGSLVAVRTGDVRQVRSVGAAAGYLGPSELSAHFGLGAAPVVDELQGHWADGSTSTYHQVPTNRTLTITAQDHRTGIVE